MSETSSSARFRRFASAVMAISLAACGGSTTTGLFVGDGGAEGGGGGGSGSGSGAASSGGSAVPGGSVGSPGGNTQSLACGTASCAIPAESCCVSDTGGFTCVSGASCPPPAAGGGGGSATALRCSGAENCAAGTVCCVYDTHGVVAADCKTACGSSEAQLCDPAAASPGCASGTGACSSKNISDWGLPQGYATCGGVGN